MAGQGVRVHIRRAADYTWTRQPSVEEGKTMLHEETGAADLADAETYRASRPVMSDDFDRDAETFSQFWLRGLDLVGSLPEKPSRSSDQQNAAEAILTEGRSARVAFLHRHAGDLYRRITQDHSRFMRAHPLLDAACDAVPGLLPDASLLELENSRLQKDKDGHELDQGTFLNQIIGDADAGTHFCHAALLPTEEAVSLLPRLIEEGRVDLEGASVERKGRMSIVTMRNPRFLNAEDDSNVDTIEVAVDLALLDPGTEMCILRGGRVEHPKYAGQRIFGTGINLTKLNHGDVSFLWYVKREWGFINKIYRGLARPDISPNEVTGETLEKPWVGQLDNFAIGGSCQIVLVCDYIVAGDNAYMTLPARKEGIIPGFANIRLWRFVGDRLARQGIQSELRFDCDSPEGRQICDEIVPRDKTDEMAETVVENFLNSGAVSAAANRRAFRIGQEDLDVFRRYAAFYCKAQCECHFSPQLISNLEKFWDAQNRKP